MCSIKQTIVAVPVPVNGNAADNSSPFTLFLHALVSQTVGAFDRIVLHFLISSIPAHPEDNDTISACVRFISATYQACSSHKWSSVPIHAIFHWDERQHDGLTAYQREQFRSALTASPVNQRLRRTYFRDAIPVITFVPRKVFVIQYESVRTIHVTQVCQLYSTVFPGSQVDIFDLKVPKADSCLIDIFTEWTPLFSPKGVVGGTFDQLHYGHQLLLATAALLSAKKLAVGISGSSVLLRAKQFGHVLQPFARRVAQVQDFLEQVLSLAGKHPIFELHNAQNGVDVHEEVLCDLSAGTIPAKNLQSCEIHFYELSDPIGPAGTDSCTGACLFYTEETAKGVSAVNTYRIERNLIPLETVRVPLVLTEGRRLTATFARHEVVNEPVQAGLINSWEFVRMVFARWMVESDVQRFGELISEWMWDTLTLVGAQSNARSKKAMAKLFEVLQSGSSVKKMAQKLTDTGPITATTDATTLFALASAAINGDHNLTTKEDVFAARPLDSPAVVVAWLLLHTSALTCAVFTGPSGARCDNIEKVDLAKVKRKSTELQQAFQFELEDLCTPELTEFFHPSILSKAFSLYLAVLEEFDVSS